MMTEGSTALCYKDWLLSDHFTPVMKTHSGVGSGLASIFWVRQEEAVCSPATSDYTLQMLTHGVFNGSVDFGAGRFAGRMLPGDFAFSPDNVPLDIEGRDRSQFLVIALPGEMVRSALARADFDSSVLDRLHAGLTRDAQIRVLLGWLADHAQSGAPSGLLYTDSLIELLLARLLVLSCTSGTTHSLTSKTLDPRDHRLRRAMDKLNADLTDDVGLSELAAEVGVSPTHLASLFRAGTGLPPHRWFMKRRVERACELLEDPGRTVTDIAYACGFASSQHLATVFKKQMGSTPTEYRRARLS